VALGLAMAGVSLVVALVPGADRLLGGVGPLHHPWQPLTSAFAHGFPGFPMPLHLAGNLVLLALVGPVAERRLGSVRFLALTLFAIGLYAAARGLGGPEAQGSSVFLYAYLPVAAWPHARAPSSSPHDTPEDRERARAALWVMGLLLPLGMGALLMAGGAAPLPALVLGNLYHLTGALAGCLGVVVWRRRIAPPPTPPPE